MNSNKDTLKIKSTKDQLLDHAWYLIKQFLFEEEFARITHFNKFISNIWKTDPRFAPGGKASNKRFLEMYQQAEFLLRNYDKSYKSEAIAKSNISESNAKNFYLSKNFQKGVFKLIENLSCRTDLDKIEYNNAVIPAMLSQHMFMYEIFHKNSPIKLFQSFIDRHIKDEYMIVMLSDLRNYSLKQYYELRPEILYQSIRRLSSSLVIIILNEFKNYEHKSDQLVYNKALILASEYNSNVIERIFEKEHDQIIDLLIQTKADVKECEQEQSLLPGSIRRYSSNSVRLLLSNSADPNNRIGKFSPLATALSYWNSTESELKYEGDGEKKSRLFQIIKELIDSGADVNASFLLEKACNLQESTCVIKLLLEKKMNPNTRGQNGETSLMRAAKACNFLLVKNLLSEYKIDVNEKNDTGETALIYVGTCATRSKPSELIFETINCLLTAGANLDVLTHVDPDYLHKFCQNDAFIPVVSLLLDKKIDINTTDKNGNTALMTALEENAFETVSYLLARNAQIHLKSKEGNSAIDIIAERFHFPHVSIQEAASKTLFKLLDLGGQIRSYDACFLMRTAIFSSNIQTLTALLSYDKIRDQINCLDSLYGIPLVNAIRFGITEAIIPLLDAKADPNIPSSKTKGSPVPLQFALDKNNDMPYQEWKQKVIKPLLEYRANPQLVILGFFSESIKDSKVDNLSLETSLRI